MARIWFVQTPNHSSYFVTGKKSLYLRLGCRGDWPNIMPPGWDPATGKQQQPGKAIALWDGLTVFLCASIELFGKLNHRHWHERSIYVWISLSVLFFSMLFLVRVPWPSLWVVIINLHWIFASQRDFRECILGFYVHGFYSIADFTCTII
jgi:hypothetical protein